MKASRQNGELIVRL